MADLVPQPSESTDQAPYRFRSSREILASADEVWSAICDHESWPEWFGAISDAGGTGGEGLGSTRFVTIAGKWRIDEEFIVWDEPREWSFTVHSADGPLGWIAESLNERVNIQVLSPDRVRVTYVMAFWPRRGRGPLMNMLKKQSVSNIRGALKGLEAHVASRRAGA